jgi:anti-anti-sigma regulatory factor
LPPKPHAGYESPLGSPNSPKRSDRRFGGVSACATTGERNGARLRNRLIAIIDIDQADGLLVDLDGVTFLDCSGIGALIAGRNTAVAAGCCYEVRNPRGMVSTILWACGVDVALGTDPAPPDAESFAV